MKKIFNLNCLIYLMLLLNAISAAYAALQLRTMHLEGVSWFFQIVQSTEPWFDPNFHRYTDILTQLPTLAARHFINPSDFSAYLPFVFTFSYEFLKFFFYIILLILNRNNTFLMACLNVAMAFFVFPSANLPLMLVAQTCMLFFTYISLTENASGKFRDISQFIILVFIGFNHESGILFLFLILFENIVRKNNFKFISFRLLNIFACVIFISLFVKNMITNTIPTFGYYKQIIIFGNFVAFQLLIISVWFYKQKFKVLSFLVMFMALILLAKELLKVESIDFQDVRRFRLLIVPFSIFPLLAYYKFKKYTAVEINFATRVFQIAAALALTTNLMLDLKLTTIWNKQIKSVEAMYSKNGGCTAVSWSEFIDHFVEYRNPMMMAAYLTKLSIVLQRSVEIKNIILWSKNPYGTEMVSAENSIFSACEDFYQNGKFREVYEFPIVWRKFDSDEYYDFNGLIKK